MLESGAEVVAQQESGARVAARARQRRIGVPRRGVANPTKPAASGGTVRVEHRLHLIAQAQIGRTDDASGNARRPVHAGGAHGRDAIHELGLADRSQRLWPIGFVHGAAFDKHGGRDGVAAVGVRQDLVEQVAPADAAGAHVPEVMVRVANR